nr:type II toxin-antitoxin system RelE/ParE family toxin [Pseudomonas sp. BGr12]
MTYIAADNPDAAVALDETFESKAEHALAHPLQHKQGRYPGTREIVVHSNYVMVYRITQDTVEFIRILHARQQWP